MSHRLRIIAAFLACVLPACALLPARADDAAPARCKYVQLAKLPIRYVGLALQPAVDGTINGEPATMLIDTGAHTAFLTMTGVLRHNLPLQLSGRFVQGVGGLSRLQTTRLEELGIGPAHVRRPELDVIRETGFAPDFDGILGAPYLLDMDMEFDLRARQMRFFEPRDCNHPTLRIWKEETVSVPFETAVHQGANPHFTVLVDGKEVDAMIDTGAARSALTLAAAKRIGIDVAGSGAKKIGNSSGIGARQAQVWRVPLKSLQIGDETIQQLAIQVMDSQTNRDDFDLLLGQDFLRAHHVLFAMSQRRLYLAYLGGEVFMPDTESSDWIRQEAGSGDPDAQYRMATLYADGPQRTAWLEKAAAAGQPHANLALGRRDLLAGQYGQAIARLRAGIAQLPTDGYGPLWLYDARVRSSQPDLARSELEASLKKQKDDAWPIPVARFYLGQEDAAQLLADAGPDDARRCEAGRLMADWHAAHGDEAKAEAVRAGTACQAGQDAQR